MFDFVIKAEDLKRCSILIQSTRDEIGSTKRVESEIFQT